MTKEELFKKVFRKYSEDVLGTDIITEDYIDDAFEEVYEEGLKAGELRIREFYNLDYGNDPNQAKIFE